MLTKLEAAQLAMHSGGIAVIANGARPDSLTRIFSGQPAGTIFLPNARMPGKRRWIAYAGRVRGCISVNAGAREAIEVRKASLLSSGILTVQGTFEAQDVVSVKDENGREFARGLAEFSSAECEQLAAKTKDVQQDGNARTKAHVLVSRDNIVLRDE
jgi:glutamate 5-kinase